MTEASDPAELRRRAEDGSLIDAERTTLALLAVAGELAEIRSVMEQQQRAERHARRRS